MLVIADQEMQNILGPDADDGQHFQGVQVQQGLHEFALANLVNNAELVMDNDFNNENDGMINIDDMNLNELVGPGEPGFPEQPFALEENPFGPQNEEEIPKNEHGQQGANGEIVDEAPGQQIGMEIDEGPEQPQDQGQNLNVGFAMILGPQEDPVWAERHRNAEATRLWAQFFAIGNQGNSHASIPSQWANFFTVMLLNPEKFDWAKEFLSSNISSTLGNVNGVIDFFIPRSCPSQIKCITSSATSAELGKERGENIKKSNISQEVQQEPEIQKDSTPMKTAGKRVVPVVDTGLRRSSRIKQVSGGYKTVTCSDRRCLHYTPNPPTLSTQASGSWELSLQT
jgi:hypothetical protein